MRFLPSSMRTRLRRRTGAKVRIAIATASCAVTAALTGAWSLCQARLLHQNFRQRDHFAPDTLGQHLPDHSQIFRRQPFSAMVFQRRPHFVETFKRGFVQATGLTGHSQHFLGEVDGTGVRLVPVLLPICVDGRAMSRAIATLCSLPNQRSAARTLDLWLANVLAVTPTRAWCKWATEIRTEDQRAGITVAGRPVHLATCR